MISDLETDLTSLEKWLNDTENKLSDTTCVDPSWTEADLKSKLHEHTVRI